MQKTRVQKSHATVLLSTIGIPDSAYYSGKLLLLKVHVLNEDYIMVNDNFFKDAELPFSILIRCYGKNLAKLNYLFKEFVKFSANFCGKVYFAASMAITSNSSYHCYLFCN